MHSQKGHIKSIIFLSVLAIALLFSSCRKPVYYSSTRVYNARAEQNKRLKKKGYSNQQYKKSNRKSKAWHSKNNFRKRRHKQSSSNKSGRK